MNDTQNWYIVKQKAGQCEIVSQVDRQGEDQDLEQQVWGPFSSREEAIAKRVGLIRAHKCQPI
jgi:hypothetical protein